MDGHCVDAIIYLLTDGQDGRGEASVQLVAGSAVPVIHTTTFTAGSFCSGMHFGGFLMGGGGFFPDDPSASSVMRRIAAASGGTYRELSTP